MMTAKDYVTKNRGVRVTHAFGFWSVGDVFYPNGCERDMLLANGCVEEVPPEPEAGPETEEKTEEPPAASKRKTKGS